MSEALFAVVGHPNKGKSSIVATLTEDDSIAISGQSGTTTRCRYFPMSVDSQVLYTLVDTPGFQRARKALRWLNEHNNSLIERRATVAGFLDTYRDTGEYPDECELLQPILNGAGIIYVVDGSVPFGNEYEAEMDILRWTGQPSLALINSQGDGAYEQQWRDVLGQYFQVVRSFNAMSAEFDKRIDLLSTFALLDDRWRHSLELAVDRLKGERQARNQRAATIITTMLIEMVTHVEEQDIGAKIESKTLEPILELQYKNFQRRREEKGRRNIEKIFDYRQLVREESAHTLELADLFSMRDWYLWGLNKAQLTLVAAGASAAAGAVLDAVTLGASLGAAALASSILGGGAAWFYSDKLASVRIKQVLPLGGRTIAFGPSRHRNFPYVILGRALRHLKVLKQRTHAQRQVLSLTESEEAQDLQLEEHWYQSLEQEEKSALDKLMTKLSTGKDILNAQQGIVKLLEPLIAAMDESPKQ